MITLVLVFMKIKDDDEIRFTTSYSNSKPEKKFNEKIIDDIF